MPIKEVANKKCVVRVTPAITSQPGVPNIIWPLGGTPGLPPTGPAYYDFTIDKTSFTEASKTLVEGEKVILDKFKNKQPGTPTSGGTAADFSCQVPPALVTQWVVRGAYEVKATAAHTLGENKAVMRQGDSTLAACQCSGQYIAGSSTIACSGSCTIQIANAGQTRVKAQ